MPPKRIKLTQGKYAIVDAEDFEWLNQWKWYFIKDGYAVRSDYTKGRPPKQVKLHRQIMGEPEGKEIDHINGNKLDNRRSNLRIVTRNQNQQNARLQKNSRSGFRGVSWNSQASKWKSCLQAQIGGEKKTVYLGHFDNPRDGALAYNQAALKYFGEYARLNNV